MGHYAGWWSVTSRRWGDDRWQWCDDVAGWHLGTGGWQMGVGTVFSASALDASWGAVVECATRPRVGGVRSKKRLFLCEGAATELLLLRRAVRDGKRVTHVRRCCALRSRLPTVNHGPRRGQSGVPNEWSVRECGSALRATTANARPALCSRRRCGRPAREPCERVALGARLSAITPSTGVHQTCMSLALYLSLSFCSVLTISRTCLYMQRRDADDNMSLPILKTRRAVIWTMIERMRHCINLSVDFIVTLWR